MARLVKTQSNTHFIPVWDCPNCGVKNQPLTTKGPWVHPLNPDEEIYISFCPNCEIVPEDESRLKGYASFRWLRERGYKRVRGTLEVASNDHHP